MVIILMIAEPHNTLSSNNSSNHSTHATTDMSALSGVCMRRLFMQAELSQVHLPSLQRTSCYWE
jgi:hypothetical protein